MKKINWGIIGLGNIAKKFAEGFFFLDNAIVKGIASTSNYKLNSFKKKFNIEEKYCFTNYQKLISCPDIDIIYIALPNSLHAKYINECIRANKNILVEKPAFMEFEDFNNFKNLSLNSKCYFTEGFMYRYLPYFKKIKNIIEDKSLGDVSNIISNFNIKVFKEKKIFGIKFRKPNYSKRLFNKSLGGGSILDLGCYPLSLSTFINSISYNVSIKNINLKKINSQYCDSGVDVHSSILLDFDKKFTSHITCSFKEKMNQNTRINFTNGYILIEDTWAPGKNMQIIIFEKKKEKKIEFVNENIYSYQIKSISNQLIENKIDPIFPSMNLNEIEMNTFLLSKWINN